MAPHQFEVFSNPSPAARRAFPLLVVLQSDLAESGRERTVAPLVLGAAVAGVAGRLTPIVSVQGREYVVMVHLMTTAWADDLRRPVAGIAEHRERITLALDYLFFGI
jgi:toxin CcdB